MEPVRSGEGFDGCLTDMRIKGELVMGDDTGRTREGMMEPDYKSMSNAERSAAGVGFHLIERVLLVLVAIMTLGGVANELSKIWEAQQIELADILLMFIYTEVIAMVAVFYTGQSATFVFPIFIAITASARLIILQGKEMAPENIVFESSAILLLTIAAVVLIRWTRH